MRTPLNNSLSSVGLTPIAWVHIFFLTTLLQLFGSTDLHISEPIVPFKETVTKEKAIDRTTGKLQNPEAERQVSWMVLSMDMDYYKTITYILFSVSHFFPSILPLSQASLFKLPFPFRFTADKSAKLCVVALPLPPSLRTILRESSKQLFYEDSDQEALLQLRENLLKVNHLRYVYLYRYIYIYIICFFFVCSSISYIFGKCSQGCFYTHVYRLNS